MKGLEHKRVTVWGITSGNGREKREEGIENRTEAPYMYCMYKKA
jgi:hypothetical protein